MNKVKWNTIRKKVNPLNPDNFYARRVGFG